MVQAGMGLPISVARSGLLALSLLAASTAPTLAQSDRTACDRADLPLLQRTLDSRIIHASDAPVREDSAGGVRTQCRVLGSDWRAQVTFVDLRYIRSVRKAVAADAIAERMNTKMISLSVEQPRRADELIRASNGPDSLSYTAAFSYRVATVAIDQLSKPLSAEAQARLREYAELLALRR